MLQKDLTKKHIQIIFLSSRFLQENLPVVSALSSMDWVFPFKFRSTAKSAREESLETSTDGHRLTALKVCDAQCRSAH
jgi:hypothetical protein